MTSLQEEELFALLAVQRLGECTAHEVAAGPPIFASLGFGIVHTSSEAES